MVTVKSLREMLSTLPDDAFCYAYQGEISGIVIRGESHVREDGAQDHVQFGYIPTSESTPEDCVLIKD